jgi:hypothetical protein
MRFSRDCVWTGLQTYAWFVYFYCINICSGSSSVIIKKGVTTFQKSPTKFPDEFFLSPFWVTCSNLIFITWTMLDGLYKSQISLLCNFLSCPLTSSHRYKYFPEHIIFEHVKLFFFPHCKRHCLTCSISGGSIAKYGLLEQIKIKIVSQQYKSIVKLGTLRQAH